MPERLTASRSGYTSGQLPEQVRIGLPTGRLDVRKSTAGSGGRITLNFDRSGALVAAGLAGRMQPRA